MANPYTNINKEKILIASVVGGLSGGLNSIQLLKSSGVVAKVYTASLNTSITVAESVAKQAVDKGFNGRISMIETLVDVAIDIIPIPIKKLKLDRLTEKAIKKANQDLDRAARLARGTTRISREAALNEAQENLVKLTNKKELIEKMEEVIVKQTKAAIGGGTKALMSKPKETYDVNYYGQDEQPYGSVGYSFESCNSAMQVYKKELKSLKSGQLPEGIINVKNEKRSN